MSLKQALHDEKAAQEEANRAKQKYQSIGEQIAKTTTSLMTVYAAKKLREFWKEAIDYAKLYYDQLNEIRIVTMMSEGDAEQLGQRYRRMAEDMRVSSTEIAKGAVEFYRQGLPDAEVDKRLENTVRYAKISGISFKEAAELVTAATNAMEVEAQQAVDIFAYLGDASASGAEEVGVAMQRASSSA